MRGVLGILRYGRVSFVLIWDSFSWAICADLGFLVFVGSLLFLPNIVAYAKENVDFAEKRFDSHPGSLER